MPWALRLVEVQHLQMTRADCLLVQKECLCNQDVSPTYLFSSRALLEVVAVHIQS